MTNWFSRWFKRNRLDRMTLAEASENFDNLTIREAERIATLLDRLARVAQ
jgi:hypothetical protein